MREMLFHGKRTDNGEWIEGYYAGYGLICPNEPESIYNATGDYYGQTPYVGFVEVDPETVGRYTGLKDKNGKRIFEGDIFDWGYAGAKGLRYVVVYDAGLAAFVGERSFGFVSLNGIDIEIIGNIHDNGELMEERRWNG